MKAGNQKKLRERRKKGKSINGIITCNERAFGFFYFSDVLMI